MVVEISLKLLHCTMCEEKFQIYGVHIPSKSTESSNFYICPIPTQNAPRNSCDLPYRQKRIIHPPRKHPFENLFPTTAERDRENWFDLSKFSQEIEDNLKHHVFLYFV